MAESLETRPPGAVVDKHNLLGGIDKRRDVMLELGCGDRRQHEGAITIDALDYDSVDVVGDVFDVLARIPSASVSAVYSSHLIEHLAEPERLIRELARVLRPAGEATLVAPHFSNPYFYSDYTHRSFFGLYSLSYLADDHILRRRVPRYTESTGLEIVDLQLVFKAAPPFYLRYALGRLVQLLVNCSTFTKEYYEGRLCYLFPCYEVRYRLRRREGA